MDRIVFAAKVNSIPEAAGSYPGLAATLLHRRFDPVNSPKNSNFAAFQKHFCVSSVKPPR
jgi:hypothetical protein